MKTEIKIDYEKWANEIVAYKLKSNMFLIPTKNILRQYLADNELTEVNPNPDSKSFAVNSAFYDVFVKNGMLETYYKPVYNKEVNTYPQPPQPSFTREDMEGFAEWIKNNKWQRAILDSWISLDGNGNQLNFVETTSQLLTLYIEQK